MKEFVDKLIERLRENSRWVAYGNHDRDIGMTHRVVPFDKLTEIVKDLASEHNNGWIEKLLEAKKNCGEDSDCSECTFGQIEDRCILTELQFENDNGWIPCSERLPESENKNGWVSCIVSVVRNHYPTSTYDICDAPYDESIVMHANYDVLQKIWHLECGEQLNALIDIEDAPLNGDYIEAWQPLPAPYKKGE